MYLHSSRFATLDYPWGHPQCGFGDFEIKRENEMRSILEAIHAIDKAYLFSQRQVFVHVTPGTNPGIQLDGPVVMISPIHESSRDDRKYQQKDEKNSVFKNRVTFPERSTLQNMFKHRLERKQRKRRFCIKRHWNCSDCVCRS
jgi:hypothetical protein